jgi:hypothetical protein
MIAQQESAHELIARCRAAGKTDRRGRPALHTGHEQFPEVDHFVLNEAEVTLPEFLRDFARGPRGVFILRPSFPICIARRRRCGNWRTCPAMPR